MDPLLNEFTQLPWLPIQTVAARMIAALVCGALVGFEREWRNHPAGLRTHMLVCLASACVAILAIEISHMAPFDNESTRIDPLRLIEAVTGGVAFLAAGFIVFTNGRVRGLTTGAGMWLAGSIGLACGLGALHIAAIATGLSILVLWILGHVERGLSEDDDPDGKYGD